MDSEVEDRVDGVKLHLSRSKDSSRTLSDDVSMRSPRWVILWAGHLLPIPPWNPDP